MDLNPSAEQQQLVDAFAALYGKESSTERVRAAEPLGYDPELWRRLRGLGVLEMALDEGAGGWGAAMLDLALVAEQHGRFLGSAPLIEAQVAARLLARLETGGASDLLQLFETGSGVVTLALHCPRNGKLGMVPAGAVADRVIFFDGERLLVCGTATSVPVANLGSMPVADVTVGGSATELASGNEAREAFELARDEWLLLMANALVGLAARSIEIGVEYVKERKAFGVPIGSFQSVAHGLANATTAVDGGTLLARQAAWATDEGLERARELAALAFGFCADAAREASYRSLHYHGGYGFMLEYDIQLFFRRAKAWPALFAEPSAAFSRAARRRLAARVSQAGEV